MVVKLLVLFCLIISTVLSAGSASVVLKDDFNAGADGWSHSGNQGKWLADGGVDGGGALAIIVAKDDETSSAWRSSQLDFVPSGVYGMRFKARSERSSAGTVTAGTGFCNVDIGVPGTEWEECGFCFVAPPVLNQRGYVKLGLWLCTGHFFFDDLEIFEVNPVHKREKGVFLGEGETINGNSYAFTARMDGESRNYSRPLAGFNAGFNTMRWCLGAGSYVEYRHELPAREFTSLRISLNCGYYHSGSMQVMVSVDADQWIPLGGFSSKGSRSFEVPEKLLPADKIYVRLAGDKDECNLQIYDYSVTAQFKGEPLKMEGHTYYVEKIVHSDAFSVDITSIDFDAESQKGAVELSCRNKEAKASTSKFQISGVNAERKMELGSSEKVALAEGDSGSVSIPFALRGVGEWSLKIRAGDNYEAGFNLFVPHFFDNSYGELLPSESDDLVVWQASSGWKIPRGRALPDKKSRRMEISLAANERESVQLVAHAVNDLKNVVLTVSEFKHGRRVLPDGAVEIDKVGYVPVQRPTDPTGVIADWPDPILPQDAPCDLKKTLNQPYWIRVAVPKGVNSGKYDGYIYVKADGISERVKLRINVYDFELPDRMSCESAFGMGSGRILQYHRAKSIEDKRVIIDKYLKCLSDNHISPYDPAPFDRWKVEFKGLPAWRGGIHDSENAYKGQFSYKIEDNSEARNASATYAKNIKLPGKPLKLCFAHRSDKKQRSLFTLNFHDSDGGWISGNNRDMWFESSPDWKCERIMLESFPPKAVEFRITLWGAGYYERESSTGITWFDEITVTEADSGKIVFDKGDFEVVSAEDNLIAVEYDWEAWDKQMERAFNEFHFNSFRFAVQGLGGGTFMSRNEPRIAGLRECDPFYSIALEKYLAGAEQHLKDKGWLKDAYIYWFDEPAPKDYEFVMNGFGKLKKHAPGLRRMLTEQVEPELVGGPNLWCPLTPRLNVEGTARQRKAGDEFWWYVCCAPKAPYVTLFIDHPGAEMRLWLWQTWQEKVTGILIWETVYWHSRCAYPDSLQNPYEDPMGWVAHGEKGERRPWGNGDGRFMYPPPSVFKTTDPVVDGPVPTIRLEMLRDGLEDYEYFVILKKLLAENQDKLSRRKREKYAALLKVPTEVSSSLTEFNIDPSAMELHRAKLAEAIEALSR